MGNMGALGSEPRPPEQTKVFHLEHHRAQGASGVTMISSPPDVPTAVTPTTWFERASQAALEPPAAYGVRYVYHFVS